jgi:RNA polymerase sigma-70 factor (ECF subfamily)
MRPKATEADINDWLDRLRRSDDAAVEAIYRGYYSSTHAFVKFYIDDPMATEEIVDDTFMAVFIKPEQFTGRSSFKTWLLGIAKIKCHDWLRRTKREPSIGRQDDKVLLDSFVDQTWPVLDHLEIQQTRNIVQVCLQRLPKVQREIMYLVFYEDMSIDQVSEHAQCASGTVKSRLFHAKIKLAECINRRLNDGVA